MLSKSFLYNFDLNIFLEDIVCRASSLLIRKLVNEWRCYLLIRLVSVKTILINNNTPKGQSYFNLTSPLTMTARGRQNTWAWVIRLGARWQLSKKLANRKRPFAEPLISNMFVVPNRILLTKWKKPDKIGKTSIVKEAQSRHLISCLSHVQIQFALKLKGT